MPKQLFQKGHPGGPGRPKGSRNQLGEDFIGELYAKFQEHGAAAIEHMAQNDQSGFVKVIAGILPKELEIKRPEQNLSDSDLARVIDALQGQLATSAGQAPPRATAAGSAAVN